MLEQAHQAITFQMLRSLHSASVHLGVKTLMKKVEQTVVDACSHNLPTICTTVEREIERPCVVLKAMVMQTCYLYPSD